MVLNDPIDLYVTLPFQTEEIHLDVKFTPGTSQVLTELHEVIPFIPPEISKISTSQGSASATTA